MCGREGDINAAGTTDRFRVTNTNLGKEPNDPLAYAPELEIQHSSMSKFGDPGGRLDRKRGIETTQKTFSSITDDSYLNTTTTTYKQA